MDYSREDVANFLKEFGKSVQIELDNSILYKNLAENISGDLRVLYKDLIEEMADESYEHFKKGYKYLHVAHVIHDTGNKVVITQSPEIEIEKLYNLIKKYPIKKIDIFNFLLKKENDSIDAYKKALSYSFCTPEIQDYLEEIILEESTHIYELRKLY